MSFFGFDYTTTRKGGSCCYGGLLSLIIIISISICLTTSSSSSSTITPEQIHIALGGPYAMTICWFTQDDTENSVVMYGVSESYLPDATTGSSHQYLVKHGYHHTVQLTGLQPNTTYYYKVGDGKSPFSPVYHFYSPPDGNTEPFSIAIFGDMGYLDDASRPKMVYLSGLKHNWTAIPSRELLELLKDEGKIDWVWHVGDISYSDDAFAENLVEFEYEKCYNGWMNWIQNITSIMPYMVTVGNHESECHSGVCFLDGTLRESLRNFTAYNARWKMPSSTSDGVLSMWYSFDYGPVHFVAMNTETDWPGAGEENDGDSGVLPAGHFAPNGTYLAWLEADLAKASLARQNKSPGYRNWIVVGGHRPYWEIIKGPGVEDMFIKYGVDLYFAGHMHSYLRSFPVAKGVIDEKSVKSAHHYHDAAAPVYIVAGGTGCDEMGYVEDPFSKIYTKVINSTNPIFNNFGLGDDFTTDRISLGVLDVVNQTALHWVLYDSTDHTVIDEVWYTKSS